MTLAGQLCPPLALHPRALRWCFVRAYRQRRHLAIVACVDSLCAIRTGGAGVVWVMVEAWVRARGISIRLRPFGFESSHKSMYGKDEKPSDSFEN